METQTIQKKAKRKNMKFKNVHHGTECAIYCWFTPEGYVYVGGSSKVKKRMHYHIDPNAKISPIAASVRKHMGEGTEETWAQRRMDSVDKHSFKILLTLPDETEQPIIEYFEEIFIQRFEREGAVVLNKNKNGGKGKSKRKVGQYTLNGQLIRIFNSQTDASRFTGITQGNISACVSQKGRVQAGGYIWKTVYDDDAAITTEEQ